MATSGDISDFPSSSGTSGLASYPGLLAPAFVTYSSTASDKRWGEKAWVRGY